MPLGGTIGYLVVKSFIALINLSVDKKAIMVGGRQPQLARIGGVGKRCLIFGEEARITKRKEINTMTGINLKNKVAIALKIAKNNHEWKGGNN